MKVNSHPQYSPDQTEKNISDGLFHNFRTLKLSKSMQA